MKYHPKLYINGLIEHTFPAHQSNSQICLDIRGHFETYRRRNLLGPIGLYMQGQGWTLTHVWTHTFTVKATAITTMLYPLFTHARS